LVFHAKGAQYGREQVQVRRYCDEISNIVQLFLPGCQDVQKILYARVPIIKYRQELVGLDCDLSMTSSSGLYMSCLLHLWAGTDWRVHPLVAVVRQWAKSQRLVKVRVFFSAYQKSSLTIK
jgi:DNA polymerase sigma